MKSSEGSGGKLIRLAPGGTGSSVEGGILELSGTRLLAETLSCRTRILVHQGGTRCFAGGTEVLTPVGYVPIERIVRGDMVVSCGGSVGVVQETFRYEVEQSPVDGKQRWLSPHHMVHFVFVDGTHLTCTEGHELSCPDGSAPAVVIAHRALAQGACYTGSQSSLLENGGRETGRVLDESVIRCVDPADVAVVGFIEYEGTVYDLQVSPEPWYVVTRSNRLVHNSSKTYSIAQALVMMALDSAARGERMIITIARKRMPALKATAMKDFFEILSSVGLYDERLHNKTDGLYQLGNVDIEFVSLDDPQKIRGRKRDILWMNEANEFIYEDFLQFTLRTARRVILDYNPSDEYHWIYEQVLTRDDVTFVKSTYLDNPFLPAEMIGEIERLRETDPVAWRVYGEGERGASVATIFPDVEIVEGLPEEGEPIYGLDFGYTSPSALVEVRLLGDSIYMRQLLYQRKLHKSALMDRVAALVGASWMPIYCDAQNTDWIDEMFSRGFNAIPADKKPQSVRSGIDFMKRHKMYVDAESKDLIRELRHYKWLQDRNGNIGEVPMKENDHAIDAARYAVYTHYGRPAPWLMVEEVEDAVLVE